MRFIKRIVFLLAILSVSVVLCAQNPASVFKKYADNKQFRYVSISKGMINLASIFGKEDKGNDQMLSKVDDLKVLTLKSSRKSLICKTFFRDIEKILVAKPPFESLMEARENGVFTRVYNRTDNHKKTDILIISKSDSVQHFIWLTGNISIKELQRMIKR